MTNKRVVITTCGSLEEARAIARALVERQLAACVNIVPQVESIYRWNENVETACEWLLLIKTTSFSFERLRADLMRLHSYDVPECIEVVIEDGNTAYLDWIDQSVR